jgi:sugar-specific transcriptional regulator TrmB
MSTKRLLNTLRSLGLKPSEAKIYVYLAKKGPLTAHDIYSQMRLTKQQLYPSLENLKKKAMVYSTLERPAVFHALPFEKVLDLFMGVKIAEAEEMQEHKVEILSSWQAMQVEDLAHLENL